MTDLFHLAWLIVTEQVKFVLLISDTYGQASLFLEDLKAELEFNEMIVWLYGDLKSKKWSEDDIIISTGIRIMAKGAGQKVRGLKYRDARPDLIIMDDLENEELVANKDRRDKLEKWLNGSVFPSLSKPDGRVILIGTIIHFDSVLSRVLESDKYDNFNKKVYKIIDEDGQSIWPEYMTNEEIAELKADYSKRGKIDIFMAEYMNTPIDPETAEFKRTDFQYYKTEDIVDKKFRKYLAIDPAISEKRSSDNCAMVVVGIDKENKWYVLDKIVGIFDPYVLIENIFKLHEKWNLDKIGIETAVFQKVLIYMIRKEMRERNVFLPIEELKADKDKETRIRSLISVYRSKTLFHRADGAEADMEEELLTFPVGRRDDIIDALAYMTQLARVNTVAKKADDMTPEEKASAFFKMVQARQKQTGQQTRGYGKPIDNKITSDKIRNVYSNL